MSNMSVSEKKQAVYVGRNTEYFSYGQTGVTLFGWETGYAFNADGSSVAVAVTSEDLLFPSPETPAMVNPWK